MDEKPRKVRKPYATPKLTEYGDVAKLTQKAGSVLDGKSGMQMLQQCL